MTTERLHSGPVGHISETEALLELAEALVTSPDLQSILHLIKEVAARLTDADRASIFVFGRSRQELWTILADSTEMIRMPADKGIVGHVIRENSLLNIEDAGSDDRFYSEVDRKTGYVTKTILCVPMRGRDGTALGAIEVLNKREGLFSSHDEKLLTVLAAQAGLSIEHVEMYEDIQHSCGQLELLLDIQKNLNVAMEPEQIFQLILEKVVPAVGGSCGVIETITRSGIRGYHGYDSERGHRYWESVDRRNWPQNLQSLRSLLSETLQTRNEEFIATERIVYAVLSEGQTPRGYIAVELPDTDTGRFNPISVDYVRVVAEQTVSILAKREALEEKRRSEKQALLGSMLSTIVHDMRNPLSGITGFAQLILRKNQDEKVTRYCNIILETLTRIEKMNNELLLFVRGDTIELEKNHFDLRAFFDELLDSMMLSFEQRNIAISVEGENDISLQADRDRLYRVFANILTNARDAIDKDGTIAISLSVDQTHALVEIGDSGPGIPGHVLDRIFEPFVSYGKKNGTGLGMAIAHSIVQRHGGEISVRSQLGNGTTFLVRLPLQKQEEMV